MLEDHYACWRSLDVHASLGQGLTADATETCRYLYRIKLYGDAQEGILFLYYLVCISFVIFFVYSVFPRGAVWSNHTPPPPCHTVLTQPGNWSHLLAAATSRGNRLGCQESLQIDSVGRSACWLWRGKESIRSLRLVRSTMRTWNSFSFLLSETELAVHLNFCMEEVGMASYHALLFTYFLLMYMILPF